MANDKSFYEIDLNKKKGTFSIKNVDVSIVNSIRRTIQSNVQNVAFFFDAKSIDNTDIEIIQNDSPLHNEFLSQRLSMIPIHLKKEYIDKWNKDDFSFEINQENKFNTFMNITSKHINVRKNGIEMTEKDRDELFPPFIPDGKTKEEHFILITKLPPGTTNIYPKLNVKLQASRGCGQQHSCFSPTSLSTYMNKVVEGEDLERAETDFTEKYIERYEEAFLEELTEDQYNSANGEQYKDKFTKRVKPEDTVKVTKYYKIITDVRDDFKKQAKLKFNTIDKQRAYMKDDITGEPNHFKFKIESECGLMPSEIFTQAIDYISSRIDIHMENKSLEIKKIDNGHYEITIPNESHTIGNLIQALVYNEFIRKQNAEDLSFIGYFVTHPLENTVCMKLTSTKKTVQEVLSFFQQIALRHVKDTLENLRVDWLDAIAKLNV